MIKNSIYKYYKHTQSILEDEHICVDMFNINYVVVFKLLLV